MDDIALAAGVGRMTAFRRFESKSGSRSTSGGGPLSDDDAEMVGEVITRLDVSPIVAPEGAIPLYDDEGIRAYFARHLVPGIAQIAVYQSRMHWHRSDWPWPSSRRSRETSLFAALSRK